MNEELKEKRIKISEQLKDKKIKKQKLEIKQLKEEIENLNQEILFLNTTKKRNLKQKTRLRAKDIEKLYPISISTVWLYAKRGDITPVKNSTRVTTFCAEEIKTYFNSVGKYAYDNSPTPKDAATAKIKKLSSLNKPTILKAINKK